MPSLNMVQLIGNLGRDPELRYLPDGTATAQISIATTDTWRDKASGENRESTDWHRVVFYGGLAEVVGEHLVKGACIYVQGKLLTRKFTDKDGTDKYVTEVRASELKMLGGKRREGTKGEAPAEGTKLRGGGDGDGDDDIPF